MTTKLEAINRMLACIDHQPINTLEGTKSAFTVSAISLLDSETQRVQLRSFDFNTEEDYPLIPDVEGFIKIPDNMVKVEVHQIYLNRYVVRDKKIYDKLNHTFNIRETLRASVTFSFKFEELPEVFQRFITMSAAYKFTKQQLGSQAACVYTQEDLLEAKAEALAHEIDIGNYSMIPDYYIRNIRGEL